MTWAAKPPLSLQQVPPAPLQSEKLGSFSIQLSSMQERLQMKRMEADRGEGGWKEHNDWKPSLPNTFLSHFPELKHGSIFFPPLEKEIDFCLEFVRSGNQKRDNGTPHSERLRGAISNQSARGLTNPSIVPPQPPAAHQHIRPPLSPTLMQRDLLSPTASFVQGSSSGSFSLTICPK